MSNVGIQVRQSLVSSMLTSCAWQVYLTYIELAHRRPKIALFIGSMLAKTYEFYFKQKISGTNLSINDLADYYSDLWTKSFSKDTDMAGLGISQARMIGFSLITAYWTLAKDYDAVSVEEEGFVEIGEDRIVTHSDIRLSSGLIIELKSARTYNGRNGEYFPDYSDRSVAWKPQPMIHMLAFPGHDYEYNIVGKGEHELVSRFSVKHSAEKLQSFKVNTLAPVMRQIKHGDFPATLGPLCNYCDWAKDIKRCGLGS